MKPENGLVIRYSFLWLREFERGEEAGRKARPVCVQLLMTPSSGMQEPVVLFLITSLPPTGSDDAMLLPALEARRVGLRTPAWLIVNHLNFEANLRRRDGLKMSSRWELSAVLSQRQSAPLRARPSAPNA